MSDETQEIPESRGIKTTFDRECGVSVAAGRVSLACD